MAMSIDNQKAFPATFTAHLSTSAREQQQLHQLQLPWNASTPTMYFCLAARSTTSIADCVMNNVKLF
jgi:hypothetical protein